MFTISALVDTAMALHEVYPAAATVAEYVMPPGSPMKVTELPLMTVGVGLVLSDTVYAAEDGVKLTASLPFGGLKQVSEVCVADKDHTSTLGCGLGTQPRASFTVSVTTPGELGDVGVKVHMVVAEEHGPLAGDWMVTVPVPPEAVMVSDGHCWL